MKYKIIYGGTTKNEYDLSDSENEFDEGFFNSNNNFSDSEDESEDKSKDENKVYENEVISLNSIFSELRVHKSNYENSYEESNINFNLDYYLDELIYHIKFYKIVNDNDLNNLIPKVKLLYEKLNIETNISNANIELKKKSYIIKKLLPKESKIIYLGDYHSSVHSLMVVINYLQEKGILNNDYKLIDNYYIIFLGDIVDRGPYGIECLYIIYLLFYINNQEDYRVIILNGNHEEEDTYSRYGFSTEMNHQISTSREDFEELIEYLPLCLFIKNNDDSNSKWYQFCHGGIDMHHCNGIIKNFLDNNDKIISLNYGVNDIIGFLWSDFADVNSSYFDDIVKTTIDSNGRLLQYDNNSFIIDDGGRTTYSSTLVNQILDNLNIMTIISGHQDFTNYAFLLKESVNNNNYELDVNYPEHGLLTFKNISNWDKNSDVNSFFINSYIINMETISASVMSSATISKQVPYSVYGILDLEKNESEIVYLKPNFGI